MFGAQARLRTADGGEVAYVRVHFFASETTRAVQAALVAGEQDGVDGYIFDLRNNPGGLHTQPKISLEFRIYILSLDPVQFFIYLALIAKRVQKATTAVGSSSRSNSPSLACAQF